MCACCNFRPAIKQEMFVSNYCIECAGRAFLGERCDHTDDNPAASFGDDSDK